MKPDRWFVLDELDLEPAEVTPLRQHLPIDFEWNPPPFWCRVTYETQNQPIIHVPLRYSRFALERLDQLV